MPILRKRLIQEQAEISTSHWQLEENPFYYETL